MEASQRQVEAAQPDGDKAAGLAGAWSRLRSAGPIADAEGALSRLRAGPGPLADAEATLARLRSSDADNWQDDFAQRPELYVGAAFAGGLAVAVLLRLVGP